MPAAANAIAQYESMIIRRVPMDSTRRAASGKLASAPIGPPIRTRPSSASLSPGAADPGYACSASPG
jgi:hypothetical protein